MSKQTIAFKLKSFPQVSETFVVSNIVYAIKKGFKVKVYVNKYLGLENSSQADSLKHYGIDSFVQAPKTLSGHKFLRWGKWALMALHPRVFPYLFRYYKGKSKRNAEPLLQLYQYRRFKKNTVCHVHFNNALFPLPQLANIGYIKPKVIVTFHGYDAFLETPESFQNKYGVFYKKYVKAVTANSQYLKKQLLTLGIAEELIHIIPIGMDIDQFRGEEKKVTTNQTIKLVTVGRLVPLKGHRYAIKAVKIVRDAGYDLHYTIIGAGAALESLKAQVAQLGLSNVVQFKGKASQQEVKHTLNQNHIFVMPSTFDEVTGRREAFGLVSVEAQAMGLPVIGFNSGGFPDTLVEGVTGYTVTDRNSSEMAEKLKHLIENPALYSNMSKAAIKHAATFDHQYTTQQYIALYNKLK